MVYCMNTNKLENWAKENGTGEVKHYNNGESWELVPMDNNWIAIFHLMSSDKYFPPLFKEGLEAAFETCDYFNNVFNR